MTFTYDACVSENGHRFSDLYFHKRLQDPCSGAVLVTCAPESMNTRKGLFNWPLTAAGKNAILPCPKNPHCYATRHWWVLLQEVKVLGSKSCYREARFLTLLPVNHQQTVNHYTLDEARPGPVSDPGGNHPWFGPHPSYSWSVLFF